MYFINRKLGFAVGYRGNGVGNQQSDLIYKTTDGGFHWEKIFDKELEYKFGLQCICFRDSLNGVAVGARGKVLETTDGGNTWIQINFPFAKNAPVLICDFAGQYAIIGTFAYGLWRLSREEVSGFEQQVINNNSPIIIYPNPFYESVNIRFNDIILQPIDIEIYDSMGILVEKIDIANPDEEIQFTPQNSSSGVYFYRIKIGDKTFSGNFVKLK